MKLNNNIVSRGLNKYIVTKYLIMNLKDRLVRILVDKDGVLVRAGDPGYSTRQIEKEILRVIKEGGQVKNVSYEEYLKLRLYEKIPNT